MTTTQHAVFIGSSNAIEDTWVEEFCTRMGFTGHNFAIAGGGFTSVVSSCFLTQADTARSGVICDRADVGFVFICDLGNDIRGTADVRAGAEIVFATVTDAFPNARIIVLPVVWGNAPLNNMGARVMSISRRYQELHAAAEKFAVEVIDGSETWLAIPGDWMRYDRNGVPEVHPNAAGHARIADRMVKYMRGLPTTCDQGFKFVSPKPAIFAQWSYWTAGREGRQSSLQGNFVVGSGVGLDTELGQLDYGLWPMTTLYVPVVSTSTRQVSGTVAIFENGLIRSLSALPPGDHLIDASWRAF